MAKVSLAEYTYRVEDWASNLASQQRQAVESLTSGERHYGPGLADSIKDKVKLNQGLPEKVAFQFARKGVYLSIGVSKGYRILEKGSGVVVKTGPGEFKREKINWFTDPLNSQMDDLQRIVLEENARMAAEGLSLGISTLTIRGLG